ncbi:U-box domain-containing protein 38-like [Dorcoceras hygrometricum]|uniref:RING-type E3 ubiquitin transferase n=1 Tax=Dorcoceras hygrometricum TaxID=472368 RepID=A0A2Z7BYX5_9LAMI|nr:U-box domain-containing protein 38-like [Dorcoceras hygrometricum]
MGKNGRFRRLIISFRRSLSDSAAGAETVPPSEFLCPISKSLMFDPAVVSSGQTFERMSVQVCKDLGFTPTLPDGSTPDFSTVIPNLALKSTILNWCSKSGSGLRPSPPSYSDIESVVCSMTGSSASAKSADCAKVRASEREELLQGVAERTQVLFSNTTSDLNPRNLYCSSSSEESVIANSTPFLAFATRPTCFSYSSSPSTSSEFVVDEGSSNYVSALSSNSSPGEDESFVSKLQSLDVYEQEQAVILLRKTTRTNEEARATLCTERLLFALKNVLVSRYAAVQTNAAACVVNLSIEKGNKIKIVRAGIVPLLIDLLRNGFDESKEHAAGAMFSLAIEDENRTAMGVLGSLQPLIHALRSGSRPCRLDSALALYHLTLVQSNRVKVVRLGATGAFLGLLKDTEVAARVVLIVCNLAASDEGRAALLDAGAVRVLADVLGSGKELASESTRENCVAALHSLSLGSLRFKSLAREAGLEEVLLEVAEARSERAREKARRILEGLRRQEDEAEEEVDWEVVMKRGVSGMRYRAGLRSCPNSN